MRLHILSVEDSCHSISPFGFPKIYKYIFMCLHINVSYIYKCVKVPSTEVLVPLRALADVVLVHLGGTWTCMSHTRTRTTLIFYHFCTIKYYVLFVHLSGSFCDFYCTMLGLNSYKYFTLYM